MMAKKSPDELEVGDVFTKTIGYTSSTVYVTNTHGDNLTFSKWSWLSDEDWTASVSEIESDNNYVYLGRLRPWWLRALSFGGLLFRRYKPVYEDD